MNTRLSIDQVMGRIKSLPALPDVVHALDRALRSDTIDTERVVRLVSSDPALTATALRLANSSFYGVTGRVVSLRDAVQILGLHTLSAAVMTAAVMARFEPAACPGFDFDSTWRHALATGLCAQMLAAPRAIDESHAYTAGLLHDIGSLALATYFPTEFAATLAHSQANDIVPSEAERELLGLDHAVVGAQIAQHWKLAPAIADAIRFHHDDVASDRAGGLIDVVHLSDNIAHALDLSHAPDDMVPPLSIATWDRIGLANVELMRVFERIEQRMESLDLGLVA